MSEEDLCDKDCPFLRAIRPDPQEVTFEPIWTCGYYHIMLGELNGDDLPDRCWQCRMEQL